MNSFDFIVAMDTIFHPYTAKEYAPGKYIIFDKGGCESKAIRWLSEDVEDNINSGSWKVIEKPKNTFTTKQGQIEAAARFIVANNSYLRYHTVDSMIAKIKCTIKDMVDKINNGKDSWYTGTAGYVVTIMQEDDNYYVVEVLVSPDVSVDKEFIDVLEII